MTVGKAAGKALSNNKILNNPISNLMMGILATVLLQSSSTTTSIVVMMVGSSCEYDMSYRLLLHRKQVIYVAVTLMNIDKAVNQTCYVNNDALKLGITLP